MKKIYSALVLLSVLSSCSQSLMFNETFEDTEESTRALGGNIALVRSGSYVRNIATPYTLNRDYTIKVKNLSTTKTVVVHQAKTNGTWVDINAVYLGTAEPGFEIWTACLNWTSVNNSVNPYGNTFCLKMVANGTTYWDNNSGANYTLSQNGGELLGAGYNVAQSFASAYKNFTTGKAHFNGNIAVRNLSPTKSVTIVYTINSWQTQSSVAALYSSTWTVSNGTSIPSPNAVGVENWIFDVNTGAQVADMEYVIKYFVNGTTYYDNNHGKNYKLYVRY